MELKLKNSPQKIAFFDLDGTVYRWSLFLDVFEELISRQVIKNSRAKEYLKRKQKWQQRELPFTEFVEYSVKAYYKDIKGLPKKELESIARTLARKNAKKTYNFSKLLIKELKKQNYTLVAISHSSQYSVQAFSKIWGFDYGFGVELEQDSSGLLTGKIKNLEIFDKGFVVKKLLDSLEKKPKKTLAVGDTASDAAMFKLTQKAIAFNPSSELYDIAAKKGWHIIVERKDVIYQLSPHSGKLESVKNLLKY